MALMSCMGSRQEFEQVALCLVRVAARANLAGGEPRKPYTGTTPPPWVSSSARRRRSISQTSQIETS